MGFAPDNPYSPSVPHPCAHPQHYPPGMWVPPGPGWWTCPGCGQKTRIGNSVTC